MLKLPRTRKKDKMMLLEALSIFLLVIIVLAGITVSCYWYIFGTKNPFAKKDKTAETEKTVFVNPKYRLGNVLFNKMGQ